MAAILNFKWLMIDFGKVSHKGAFCQISRLELLFELSAPLTGTWGVNTTISNNLIMLASPADNSSWGYPMCTEPLKLGTHIPLQPHR